MNQGKDITIPKEMLEEILANKVSISESRVLQNIYLLGCNQIGCFASTEIIGMLSEIGDRQTKRIISKFLTKGLIKNLGPVNVTYKNGKTNRGRLLITKWNHVVRLSSNIPTIRCDIDIRPNICSPGVTWMSPVSRVIIKNYINIISNFYGHKNLEEKEEKKEKKVFIKMDKNDSNSPIDQFDIKCAKRLLLILHENNIRRKYSIKNWSASFASLRLLDQVKKKRITKVLLWYREMFGQPYVHKVLSGKAFRDKFYAMESKMLKDGWIPPTAITDEAKEIVGYIDYIGWPKGSKSKLPVAVQKSLDEFKAFTTKLAKISNKDRFANWMYDWLAGFGMHGFIVHWFRLINEKVRNWSKWDGNIERFAFSPSASSFQPLAREKARQWDGKETDWDKLLTKLGYNDEE